VQLFSIVCDSLQYLGWLCTVPGHPLKRLSAVQLTSRRLAFFERIFLQHARLCGLMCGRRDTVSLLLVSEAVSWGGDRGIVVLRLSLNINNL